LNEQAQTVLISINKEGSGHTLFECACKPSNGVSTL